MRAKCGKTRSNSGKLFTTETLAQHEKDCKTCQFEILEDRTLAEHFPDLFPLTDMIADPDMPDGAYFALAWELGEL